MTANNTLPVLPISEVIPQILTELNQANRLILHAPPGAGKSTLLPLYFLNAKWLKGKKIIMLEPRRLAAKNVAERLANLLGEKVGETVGYTVRFERKISARTQLEVVTEGILTRIIHQDNTLENYGLIIFDEYHERSIHADLSLAFSLQIQSDLREDMRLLVMSATLNIPELSSILFCKTISSEGKQYPVEIKYIGDTDPYLVAETAARTAIQAAHDKEGDLLIFLPGQREIMDCYEFLKTKLPSFNICPLYGNLTFGKQQAAILPDKNGKRKIVIATNIAETSLTIEGIKIVIDSGLAKVAKFDFSSGLSRLETVVISKDSADQRAGRAGRLSPGQCYRLWSETAQSRMAAHRVPEILETDLCNLLLDLYQWGITDFRKIKWPTSPKESAISQAHATLEDLEAIEENCLTEHGKLIHQLPCHPRLAHMLIKARTIHLESLATDIAAVLEEKDPLPKETGIDICARIDQLRKLRRENRMGGKFSRIEKNAASFRNLINCEINNDYYDSTDAGLLLAFAYPERIAHARPGNNAQFQLANGKIAVAGHRDSLAHEPWLAVAAIDAREGLGKIFLAAPLNPKDLAPLVKTKEIIEWNTKKGGISATVDLRIGSIVLQQKSLPNPSPDCVVEAICKAVTKEEHLLNFGELLSLQNRVKTYNHFHPDCLLTDISTTHLLQNCQEWLPPYLTNIRKPEELQRICLTPIILEFFDYHQLKQLNTFCPQELIVPSGSKIELKYDGTGNAPCLSVRLQECFGMSQTPKVFGDRQNVVMELLSPGYKPVQKTSDMASFWNNTYPILKKELQRRYPKHKWPEEPLSSPPAKGTRYISD